MDVLHMLRVGELRLPAKCAKIYLPRGRKPFNLLGLLSHAANKTVDLLIYASLDPAKRSFAFFEVEYDLPDNEERVRDIQARGMQLLCIVLETYIKYGHLDNLVDDKVGSLSYAMQGLNRGDEFRGTNPYTSLGDLSNFRMSGMVAIFPEMAPILFKSSAKRVKPSVARNRFLNILRDIRRDAFQTFGIHPVLDLITDSEVLAGAPYINLHPHHHANPLGHASNFVYALVGEYGRRNGVCWEDVFENNKGLYTKSIREKLGNPYTPFRYTQAKLPDMATALSPKYSLAHL